MQYIIMLAIVLGLALADFVTGLIKGYITHQLNSAKMRSGGLNKICELIIMATACGLEVGINQLGHYYESDVLADVLAGVAGAVAAIVVFGYIVIMELISILENYAEINKDAAWVGRLLKRLKNVSDKGDNDND